MALLEGLRAAAMKGLEQVIGGLVLLLLAAVYGLALGVVIW